MKYRKYMLSGFLLPFLCGCQSYLYQIETWNLNNYGITIDQQYFNKKKEYPFPIKELEANRRPGSFPFLALPDKKVLIAWHTKDGKSFSADVKFDVPKSFTPKDGTTIFLIFQGDRIFICYEILTGSPLTSECSRYNRRYTYIWNTGWTFSPDEYLKYYRNSSMPLEEYAEKIASETKIPRR